MKRTVISIEPYRVLLGDENGQFKEYPIASFNFRPAIGDVVEVFQSADGSKVVVNKVQSAAVPMPVAQAPAAAPQRRTLPDSPHVVNKVAYVLLALLLGGLGAHKFYAKKIGFGIVYLLLCWTLLPALAALIEGIIALCQSADENGNIVV